ncbi:hypothetical protein PIIN_07981 [Serendipita indica DSM 11827]|uniref:Uncharacterized protein n=1 Tax=Serendipita indica (strain DSM 11827) TaxID=1109443 RepID=G4TRT4_SERID|nr:hypothetical protein PIIN_07981 [Serendipita indica DSM 11827]
MTGLPAEGTAVQWVWRSRTRDKRQVKVCVVRAFPSRSSFILSSLSSLTTSPLGMSVAPPSDFSSLLSVLAILVVSGYLLPVYVALHQFGVHREFLGVLESSIEPSDQLADTPVLCIQRILYLLC